MSERYEVTRLDDLDRIPVGDTGLEWRPIRRRFGLDDERLPEDLDWLITQHIGMAPREDFGLIQICEFIFQVGYRIARKPLLTSDPSRGGSDSCSE